MRVITNLHKCNSLNVESDSDDSPHIYDNSIREKYMQLFDICERDKFVLKNWRKIVILIHPFELLDTKIQSKFIPKCPDLRITNAFMKMFEFLKYINFEPSDNVLHMFDVAGAPGMFILAAELYLRKYFPRAVLDWQTCSLEGGTALTDTYNLFKSNTDRYTSCDVTNIKDLTKIIKRKVKYELVTGDIGIWHEAERALQEEKQLDLEWGQMVLALNLVDVDGNMFLKMYSLLTYENVYLLDLLTNFFDKIQLCKPFTSRITNDESYIICIKRNNNDCSKIPLKRPIIKVPYKSKNQKLISFFEKTRLNDKYKAFKIVRNLLRKNPKITIDQAIENDEQYREYYKPLGVIINELKNVNQ